MPTDSQTAASYMTLREGVEVSGELVDRKSRFIAQIKHVKTEAEAQAFIAEVRVRHYDARHNVPAQILASGLEKASDDGEPSRTAGMPVLDVLRGANLKDVCCVVTRYFGGTLLGPGGLVRAYSGATAEALKAAEEQGALLEMTSVVLVSVHVPYNQFERVRDMALRNSAHVVGSEYAADVSLELAFKEGEEAPFLAALKEAMGGKDIASVSSPQFMPF